MKTFKLTLNYETTITAESEEEAMAFFWDREVYASQQNEGDFLNDCITVKEIKNKS